MCAREKVNAFTGESPPEAHAIPVYRMADFGHGRVQAVSSSPGGDFMGLFDIHEHEGLG